MPPRLRSGRFEVDGLEGAYSGFTRGEDWNGWAVPYFEAHVAEQIGTDYASQPDCGDGPYAFRFDRDARVVLLYDPLYGDWDEYPSFQLGGRVLYPVGSSYWTWVEV